MPGVKIVQARLLILLMGLLASQVTYGSSSCGQLFGETPKVEIEVRTQVEEIRKLQNQLATVAASKGASTRVMPYFGLLYSLVDQLGASKEMNIIDLFFDGSKSRIHQYLWILGKE